MLDALFAFVGLFSLDGVVLDVNEAPLASSGFRRDEVVGHRFVEMAWFSHSAEERSRISAAMARAGAGQPTRLETRIWSTRGVFMWIDASFKPLRDKSGAITHVVGSGVEITARKQAEQALAASEARLTEAQRVAHIGSWEWSIAEDRIWWSDELYRIYGIEKDELVPTYHGYISRVHPDDVAGTAAAFWAAVQHRAPFIYDHRIRRPDGTIRVLHSRGQVIADAQGRALRVAGSCWDITDQIDLQEELRASNDRLRALAARLDSVREEERRGMAREVHDQIGQALTALKLDLGWVRKQVAGKMNEAVVARLTGMEGLIDQTLETARRVSADLRPAILDDLGLGAAIAWQSREFEKRTGIACTLELPSERPRLPAQAAVALFRIVQEALTNVARHAGAARVWVRLEVTEEAATLTVSDDGRGAGSDELGRPSSLGVLGMRERALVLGGSVTIAGTPGAGTTVVARIPIGSTEKRG